MSGGFSTLRPSDYGHAALSPSLRACQLQFITSSTYRRLPIFLSPDYRPLFVQALCAARAKFHFALIGWVLMPEHFHLLFRPRPAQATANVVKEVKQRSAFLIGCPAVVPSAFIPSPVVLVAPASPRTRPGEVPGVAATLCSLQCRHGEEGPSKTRLQAQQHGDTGLARLDCELAAT